MSKKVILVWFRNDLRTHDNEVLSSAIEKADFIIPVYIFDKRYYQQNKFGHLNTGYIRHQYILDSVAVFKEKLQALGGDLLTYEGLPEEIIPQLVQKYEADEVYHHREVAQRETRISELVEEALWKVKRNLKHFIGHTLYHKEDLPFPIKDIPNNFSLFRKKIERESSVRQALDFVQQINIPPHLERTELPESVFTSELPYTHGEDQAINKLQDICVGKITGHDAYLTLSPYLALGSLSPIYMYHYLSDRINASNKKTINQVLEELLKRDYFRFMLKKYPNIYFKNTTKFTQTDPDLILRWTSANTENPLMNELMERLNNTGTLKYTERESLALFLIHEYQQNWLAGASWFEQQLVDYAPSTNYGCWAHLAGQGTNEKDNRDAKSWNKLKSAMEKELNF